MLKHVGVPRRLPIYLFGLVAIVAAGQAGAATGKGNDALLAGAEVFENITEAAPTLDQAGYAKLYAGYNANAATIDAALTPKQREELKVNTAGVARRWKAGERSAVALDAVEAYRTLVSAVDRSALPVPIQVSLLDYSGFRLNALLTAKPPNWSAIGKTVAEAKGFWTTIKPQVKDDTLADAMDRSFAALATAIEDRNPRMLTYAADMDLILVDGLEAYYMRKPNVH